MDNNELLRTIVDADRAARKRVDAAKQREKHLSGDRAAVFAAAEKKAMDAARRQTDTLRGEVKATADRRTAELDKKRDEALAALDREFAAKRDDCIERIFRAVVGLS